MVLTKNKLYIVTAVIALGFLLAQLSGSILSPVLPRAAQIFHTDPSSVQYFIAIFFGGYSIGQVVWGSLSDDFGRRRIARIATFMYLVCVLLVMLWKHIVFFYINYALIGFTVANYTSVGNAMLKDLYRPQQLSKVIAFIGVVMGCGPMLGALLGSNLVAFFGWDAVFVFLLCLALLVLLGMFSVVPPMTPHSSASSSVRWIERVKIILSNRVFQRSILVLSFSFAGLTSYLATSTFLFANVLHFGTYHAGLLLALPSAAYVAGALLLMILLKDRNPWVLIRPAVWGFALTAVVLLMLPLVHIAYAPAYMLTLMVALFFLGMLVPLGKAGCMTAMQLHGGTTASLMKFLQSFTTVVLSYLVARVSGLSFMPLALTFIGTACVLLMVTWCYNQSPDSQQR